MKVVLTLRPVDVDGCDGLKSLKYKSVRPFADYILFLSEVQLIFSVVSQM